jgi:hypothetical protein
MASNKTSDWMTWGAGILGGVLLWTFFKPKPVAAALGPAIQDLPPTASPARFRDLGSVSLRIKQVWEEFKNGRISAAQALSEAEGLAAAANSFSFEKGEDASVIYAQALALQDSIKSVMEQKQA